MKFYIIIITTIIVKVVFLKYEKQTASYFFPRKLWSSAAAEPRDLRRVSGGTEDSREEQW